MFGMSRIVKPIAGNSSAIAITVDQDFAGRTKLRVETVMIIKLKDKNDSLKQNEILSTNYYRTPFMVGFQADAIDSFLLNVEPGVYAAIGAFTDGIFMYFPKEVINASMVEVKPNNMVYMGEFKLQNISYEDAYFPDEFQQYYYSNQLFEKHKDYQGNMLISYSNIRLHHASKVKNVITSTNFEIIFLKSCLSTFNESGWKDMIETRLRDLEHMKTIEPGH